MYGGLVASLQYTHICSCNALIHKTMASRKRKRGDVAEGENKADFYDESDADYSENDEDDIGSGSDIDLDSDFAELEIESDAELYEDDEPLGTPLFPLVGTSPTKAARPSVANKENVSQVLGMYAYYVITCTIIEISYYFFHFICFL